MSQLSSNYFFTNKLSFYTNSVEQGGERVVFQDSSPVEKSVGKVVNRHNRKKRILMQSTEFIHDDTGCWHLSIGEDIKEIHEHCACTTKIICFCDTCCLELQ